ncbi:hypothetical protein [Pseudonocardia broussonetiae]|uniref:Uncharacterized protein n=1 Tax=Pseudonocardia broussonetiae TaxID=2736640 RepID=A0A6M6JF55_9PSEU|nr:hypothetical protein [Pseudonocardia broussonetiae]QJY45557.1 hypothetical protein HOP40_06860 [Pseudonocardia broussonetiae]
MRRKPSAEVGRSETTAELIARISAERDAPVESTGRHAVLTAPPRTTTARSRTTTEPTVRRPRRPAAAPPTGPHALEPAPRVPAPRAPLPALDDEPSLLRTGPIGPPVPAATGRRRRAEEQADPRDLPVEEDVLFDPAADETPTTVLQFVAPDAPAPRRPVRMLVMGALVAVAMVVVGAAAAGWFGGTTPNAPARLTAVTNGVVPQPAPTGPTVPAPVGAAPADVAPAPAEAPAADVRLTGGAVPPADTSYGY